MKTPIVAAEILAKARAAAELLKDLGTLADVSIVGAESDFTCEHVREVARLTGAKLVSHIANRPTGPIAIEWCEVRPDRGPWLRFSSSRPATTEEVASAAAARAA